MINLRAINKIQFDNAKNTWTFAFTLKIIIYIVGLLIVIFKISWIYMPLFVFILSVASEVSQWRSDYVKGQAEALLRKLDICKSFGKEISAADKRDIIANVSRETRKKLEQDNNSDTYFASTSESGPKRAIENLIESAWYTRRQCSIMSVLYIIIFIFFIAISIAGLLIATQNVQQIDSKLLVAKTVTSWLMLVFSLSVFKNAWGYYRLYQRCQKTEATGEFLLKNDISESDAIKQWYEYQLGRSSGPLLPNWLWKVVGTSLDEAWRESRHNNE